MLKKLKLFRHSLNHSKECGIPTSSARSPSRPIACKHFVYATVRSLHDGIEILTLGTWREYFHYDESTATGFNQSNLGLVSVWPARHDNHSIADFASKRQDRSSRAEAADRDHALEPTLCSTRRWKRQQLYSRRTGQFACRTRWLASSPLALGTAELVGSTATEPETRTSLSESTEEMPVVSLRRIAPPGFLSQSFAADSTTDCVS